MKWQADYMLLDANNAVDYEGKCIIVAADPEIATKEAISWVKLNDERLNNGHKIRIDGLSLLDNMAMNISDKNKRRPTIGIGALIVREPDRKILIGKRGQDCKRGKGMFALPGGNVNINENICIASTREIYEETGLVTRNLVVTEEYSFNTIVPFAITDHYPIEDHISLWYLMAPYLGTKEPVIKEPQKCESWQWLSIKEIAEIFGSNDKNSEQYYWLPIDVFRLTLPKSIFGEF